MVSIFIPQAASARPLWLWAHVIVYLQLGIKGYYHSFLSYLKSDLHFGEHFFLHTFFLYGNFIFKYGNCIRQKKKTFLKFHLTNFHYFDNSLVISTILAHL